MARNNSNKPPLQTTHGMYGTPENKAWDAIKQRCRNPHCRSYKDYGARGITVCARWIESFENFYVDMGPRPSPKHTLGRKDNDKGYYPENCEWQTTKVQSRLKRNNHLLTFQGQTMCITDWALAINLKPKTLAERLRRGLSTKDALTLPLNRRQQNILSR